MISQGLSAKIAWRKLVRSLSSLQLAIAEMAAIAGLSAIGTVIPQNEVTAGFSNPPSTSEEAPPVSESITERPLRRFRQPPFTFRTTLMVRKRSWESSHTTSSSALALTTYTRQTISSALTSCSEPHSPLAPIQGSSPWSRYFSPLASPLATKSYSRSLAKPVLYVMAIICLTLHRIPHIATTGGKELEVYGDRRCRGPRRKLQ